MKLFTSFLFSSLKSCLLRSVSPLFHKFVLVPSMDAVFIKGILMDQELIFSYNTTYTLLLRNYILF